MNDESIIELFFSRSEDAITEAAKKYGAYCRRIAENVLGSSEDAEECLNDTYLSAWNSIPPKRPRSLSSFLGRITRNHAINRIKADSAKKRGGGEYLTAIDELADILPAERTAEEEFDASQLRELLEEFLDSLPRERRAVFVGRYWHFDSVSGIAKKTAHLRKQDEDDTVPHTAKAA